MCNSFYPLPPRPPVFPLDELLLSLCKSPNLVRLAHRHWWYTPLHSSPSPHFPLLSPDLSLLHSTSLCPHIPLLHLSLLLSFSAPHNSTLHSLKDKKIPAPIAHGPHTRVATLPARLTQSA